MVLPWGHLLNVPACAQILFTSFSAISNHCLFLCLCLLTHLDERPSHASIDFNFQMPQRWFSGTVRRTQRGSQQRDVRPYRAVRHGSISCGMSIQTPFTCVRNSSGLLVSNFHTKFTCSAFPRSLQAMLPGCSSICH